jgi:hypothetical protein
MKNENQHTVTENKAGQALFDDLFKELRSLGTIFPKTCANCGRSYSSLEDFLKNTSDMPQSTGLLEIKLQSTSVGLMRNCSCHSTLMVECMNRRDNSPRGNERRKIFDRLMSMLKTSGMSATEARAKLRKSLRDLPI